MVWIFKFEKEKYEVIRVSDPNYFSKYNYKHLIMSMHPQRSKLVKEMVVLANEKKCPKLKKFVKDFIEDYPEYQL
jgi:hypothetical protein